MAPRPRSRAMVESSIPILTGFTTVDPTAVRLQWRPVAGAEGYEVTGGGTARVRRVAEAEAVVRGLPPGEPFRLSVRAIQGGEPGAWASLDGRAGIVPPSPASGAMAVDLLDADRQSVQLRLPTPEGTKADCRFRLWWQPSDEGWWGDLEVPTNTPAVSGRRLGLNCGMLDHVPGVLAGNLVLRATGMATTAEPGRAAFRYKTHEVLWEPSDG